jgi:ribulose-phosphate 3-epimerase
VETLIVPAIIAKNQVELDSILERIKGRVKRAQLDIMDGKFVPNTSLDFDFELVSSLEYEAHLMTKKPLDWVKKNAHKVDIVIMHIETLEDVGYGIEFAKKRGVKVNLAFTLETDLATIIPYLEVIDGVLAMTVEPGSYCIEKTFHPEPLEKIKRLREIDKNIPIEVDGCMNPENAKMARDAGANIIASGSYILKSEDVEKAINELAKAVMV